MPNHYYIDGYNVIHHCPQLSSVARDHFESARDTFVELVARFCSTTEELATIVFDGRGRRAESHAPVIKLPGLEVVYSPHDRSADAVIERFAYQARNKHEVVVVTADRGIRDLCRGIGVHVMDAENFLRQVNDAVSRARAHLDEDRRRMRQHVLGDRLSGRSRAVLDAIKDRLKPPD